MMLAYLMFYPPLIGKVQNTSLTLLLVPVLMLAGYFAVYVITPNDLSWHLATSLDRLFVQIWPLSVFVLCSAA
jgi:hypothetical protein